jgi:hypothetical protein
LNVSHSIGVPLCACRRQCAPYCLLITYTSSTALRIVVSDTSQPFSFRRVAKVSLPECEEVRIPDVS